MAKNKNIVLGITGSIAAYKAGDIIRRLREKGFEVSVVLTKEAEKFITPLTLKSLSGKKIYTDMFEAENDAWEMSHISLAQTAALLLIAPATANIIGKLSAGLADDLLSCIAMATKAPLVLAPAMNDEMYQNKIVQENIARLKKVGVKFIEPIQGKLACGITGIGHLAEVDDIVSAVEKLLK